MTNIVDLILKNFSLIVNVVAVVAIVALFSAIGGLEFKAFATLPRATQMRIIKANLVKLVKGAEVYFGSETGDQKLKLVYEMIMSMFPAAKAFITLEQFDKLVDEALVKAGIWLAPKEDK